MAQNVHSLPYLPFSPLFLRKNFSPYITWNMIATLCPDPTLGSLYQSLFLGLRLQEFWGCSCRTYDAGGYCSVSENIGFWLIWEMVWQKREAGPSGRGDILPYLHLMKVSLGNPQDEDVKWLVAEPFLLPLFAQLVPAPTLLRCLKEKLLL